MTGLRDERAGGGSGGPAPRRSRDSSSFQITDSGVEGANALREAQLRAELHQIMVAILRSHSIIHKLILRKRGLRLKAQLEIVRKTDP